MSYLGRSAKLSLKAQEKVSFLATAGQTSKTGLSYVPSFVEVYVNGILLTDTTDFTATNGNSVTFTVALALNDEVTVISLKTFSVANHYTISAANTLLAAKATNTAVALKAPIASPNFTGGIDVTGTVTADGLTVAGPTELISNVDTGNTLISGGNVTNVGANLSLFGGSHASLADVVRFRASGSETMRIDSSGNVGIGTSSPDYKLDVSNTVQIRAGYGLRLQNAASSAAATIQCAGAGGNSDLTFNTASAERMRIDSSGNVGINSAPSTGSRLTLQATSNQHPMVLTSTVAGYHVAVMDNNATSGTRQLVSFRIGNSSKGGISSNGTAVTYGSNSDYRLKTDVQPMTGATATFKQLKPVNFEWIADGTRVDGFLAHELAEVIPAAATGTKDAMMDEEYEVTAATDTEAAVMGTRSVPDMQGIDQSKLVPLLTATIQELIARIEALENV